MNTNLVHNILNVMNVVLAGITTTLLTSGCVQAANGAVDCSASFIDPKYTAIALIATNALKLGINTFRDGLAGLAKKQPPVQ